MKKARSEWREAVLICRKCSKKLGGGFGPRGDKRLKKALRKQLKLAKGRKAEIGLVEVDCLKLCPKGAVTLVLGSAPGRMWAVPPGASVKDVARELGLAPQPEAGEAEAPSDTGR